MDNELSEAIRNSLKAPFPEKDIEWRMQASGLKGGKPWGRVLAYVTNRAIMERLDEVFGIFGWQNEYKAGPQGGVLCGISIKNPETGEWITKYDGAENTNIEAVKGGLSSSMKRAGSMLSIGRYLYELEEGWADFIQNGRYGAKIKKDSQDTYPKMYKWNPPRMPVWALPRLSDDVVIQQQFTTLMNQTPIDERKQYKDQWDNAKTTQEKTQVLLSLKAFKGSN